MTMTGEPELPEAIGREGGREKVRLRGTCEGKTNVRGTLFRSPTQKMRQNPCLCSKSLYCMVLKSVLVMIARWQCHSDVAISAPCWLFLHQNTFAFVLFLAVLALQGVQKIAPGDFRSLFLWYWSHHQIYTSSLCPKFHWIDYHRFKANPGLVLLQARRVSWHGIVRVDSFINTLANDYGQ